MKITKIKPVVCHAYRTNWVFVKIETDSGIYGFGESTLEYKEKAVVGAIEDLERALVGKNPDNIEKIFHDCVRDAYWRGGAVLSSALSGVEMALWDIKGKSLSVPVYQHGSPVQKAQKSLPLLQRTPLKPDSKGSNGIHSAVHI